MRPRLDDLRSWIRPLMCVCRGDWAVCHQPLRLAASGVSAQPCVAPLTHGPLPGSFDSGLGRSR